MQEDARNLLGTNLRARGDVTRALDVDAEETVLCWICLDGGEPGRALILPCNCPRHVHANCLARWQLQSAGSRREVACEFCDHQLPDWKLTLTPLCGAAAPAVMNVNFDGRTYSFEVHPGPQGYQQFTGAIRRAFSLPGDSELNITFTCDEPTAIDPAADDFLTSEGPAPPFLERDVNDPQTPFGAVAPHANPVPQQGRNHLQAQQQQQLSHDSQAQQSQQPQMHEEWPQERPTLSFESPTPSLLPQSQPPPVLHLRPLPLLELSPRQATAWEGVHVPMSPTSPTSPLSPGTLLTLQGAGAYDAAVHCASVSAARRLAQERRITGAIPAGLQGSSSARGAESGHGHRSHISSDRDLQGTHSSNPTGTDLRHKKRISAAVSRRLRALCDMLSIGR